MNVQIELILDAVQLFAKNDAHVEADSQILEEGIIDSLNVLQIMSELENAFAQKISPLDMTLDDFASPNCIQAALQRIWG